MMYFFFCLVCSLDLFCNEEMYVVLAHLSLLFVCLFVEGILFWQKSKPILMRAIDMRDGPHKTAHWFWCDGVVHWCFCTRVSLNENRMRIHWTLKSRRWKLAVYFYAYIWTILYILLIVYICDWLQRYQFSIFGRLGVIMCFRYRSAHCPHNFVDSSTNRARINANQHIRKQSYQMKKKNKKKNKLMERNGTPPNWRKRKSLWRTIRKHEQIITCMKCHW